MIQEYAGALLDVLGLTIHNLLPAGIDLHSELGGYQFYLNKVRQAVL
jgi:hypothetical protein